MGLDVDTPRRYSDMLGSEIVLQHRPYPGSADVELNSLSLSFFEINNLAAIL